MDVDEQAEKPMEEDEPVAAAANENPKSPVAGPSSATNIGMFLLASPSFRMMQFQIHPFQLTLLPMQQPVPSPRRMSWPDRALCRLSRSPCTRWSL